MLVRKNPELRRQPKREVRRCLYEGIYLSLLMRKMIAVENVKDEIRGGSRG